jgi:HEAT repeat protein
VTVQPRLLLLSCLLAPAVSGHAQARQTVADLTAALAASDASVRARAACELGQRGGDAASAAAALVAILDDVEPVPAVGCDAGPWLQNWLSEHPDAARRQQTTPAREAAKALGRLGAPGIAAATGVLGHADWRVREGAVLALGHAGRRVERAPLVDRVVSTLGDPHARVRGAAAWAAGELGSDRAVQTLGRLLTSDADAEVRRQAARALGEIESARGIEPLVAAMTDASPGVRQAAAWALGEHRQLAFR